jgi:hypothetical protein
MTELSRYSVSLSTGFSLSTNCLLSFGILACSLALTEGDTLGTQVGDNPGNSGPLLVLPNNGDIVGICKQYRTGETPGIPQ